MNRSRRRLGRLLAACAGVCALTLEPAFALRAASAAEEYAPGARVTLGPRYRLLGGAGIGRGVRFNNPYRLRTQLGDGPESLSLTATFADVWLAGVLPLSGIVEHGAVVHGSFALDGIPQEVVTPSYLVLAQPLPRWVFGARAGVPIVVEPDANAGAEVGASVLFLLTAGLGVTLEASGSLFFGAATLETSRSVIPIASLQAGVAVDYEVLP